VFLISEPYIPPDNDFQKTSKTVHEMRSEPISSHFFFQGFLQLIYSVFYTNTCIPSFKFFLFFLFFDSFVTLWSDEEKHVSFMNILNKIRKMLRVVRKKMSEGAEEERARRRADEAAHDQYSHNLESKYSSYQFYYKTNPTPEQLRRGPLWGVRRFSDLLINGRCTFNTQKHTAIRNSFRRETRIARNGHFDPPESPQSATRSAELQFQITRV